MGHAYTPEYWEEISELEPTQATRSIISWLPLAKDKKMLDIGCGAGRFLRAIESMGGYALGVDAFMTPLKMAKYRVRGDLVAASAELLPFREMVFDTVLSHHTLEHVPDLKQAINEIHRVLKPGGIFILSCPNSNYLLFLTGIVKQHASHIHRMSYGFTDSRFEVLERKTFQTLPYIGDRLTEFFKLDRLPLIKRFLYNCLVVMRKPI